MTGCNEWYITSWPTGVLSIVVPIDSIVVYRDVQPNKASACIANCYILKIRRTGGVDPDYWVGIPALRASHHAKYICFHFEERGSRLMLFHGMGRYLASRWQENHPAKLR